ncbi:DUF3857 and transglutaminase domain-containing protein [Flavobacteriaceae bacterium TP-CH-4]|uniref:DUF3857 and transglutaminase domain-containing protein n=1 Tax=Pelagihabitans pacificus TaxID=2696054 RepID=A0A967AQ99_9FLAO|nr:DUF3857 domain-containing protein [Pelagihabitans pacificus]NHF58012.1 DUF3857 and transglutaminase domain-containing protein [Pelagihabitans pacificus]
MSPRIRFVALLLFPLFVLNAQMPDTFGEISYIEKEMMSYDKDPDAPAVVLYERGDNYFKLVDERLVIVKEFHSKIKVLDEKKFNGEIVPIYLYHNGASTEKLIKIKAVTHNGEEQFNVLPSQIFTSDESERWRVKKFTFPNIKKGSILEYRYTITTPYLSRLDGWTFQSDIPKLYSEFNATIPGNYLYNRALMGYLNLDTNEATIKKHCFYLPGFKNSADCEVIKYAMKDIPAFKADEKYMLSEQNYISRIEFEISEWRKFDGTTDRFTKTWDDVDREFRHDADIGRQLTKKSFFERNVPESLLTQGDAITRAKKIYEFVKGHYNWNGEYATYGNADVKEAFNAKKGNAWEINMSLINLLNAADIKTELMLLSTRQHGLPKKVHPVMQDFNYIVAKTTIDGKEYLLDATDKYNPFGYLPYRALNHYGRVMDFKNDSYWHTIKPIAKNRYTIRANVQFNMEAGEATGIFDVMTIGYNAIDKRKTLDEYSKEKYLDAMEGELEGSYEITDYRKFEERCDEEKVAERFMFEMGDVLQGDRVYFNPFLIRFFDENPFQLEERNYPIDFGYPVSYRYQVNIEIPEGYQIQEIPQPMALALGENKKVLYRFHHDSNKNNVVLSFDLSIKNTHFPADDYEGLKELFKKVTNTQKNSLVVFKRI